MSSGTRISAISAPVCRMRSARWWRTAGKRPVMLLTSDSSFLFHIAELETAARLKLPLVCVVGVDNQWGLEVGVYKRTFGQGIAETGVHWSKDVRFDKVAEGFGCHGEYVDQAEDIGPAIKRAVCQRQAGGHPCADRSRRRIRRKCRTTASSGPGTRKGNSIGGAPSRTRPVLGYVQMRVGVNYARIFKVLYRRPVGRSGRARRP